MNVQYAFKILFLVGNSGNRQVINVILISYFRIPMIIHVDPCQAGTKKAFSTGFQSVCMTLGNTLLFHGPKGKVSVLQYRNQ